MYTFKFMLSLFFFFSSKRNNFSLVKMIDTIKVDNRSTTKKYNTKKQEGYCKSNLLAPKKNTLMTILKQATNENCVGGVPHNLIPSRDLS